METPHQKKMVWTEKTRPKVVRQKETKMEENETYQALSQAQKKANTGQTTKKEVVLKIKETLEACEAPGSLQHSRPWKASESETVSQKESEDLNKGSL